MQQQRQVLQLQQQQQQQQQQTFKPAQQAVQLPSMPPGAGHASLVGSVRGHRVRRLLRCPRLISLAQRLRDTRSAIAGERRAAVADPTLDSFAQALVDQAQGLLSEWLSIMIPLAHASDGALSAALGTVLTAELRKAHAMRARLPLASANAQRARSSKQEAQRRDQQQRRQQQQQQQQQRRQQRRPPLSQPQPQPASPLSIVIDAQPAPSPRDDGSDPLSPLPQAAGRRGRCGRQAGSFLEMQIVSARGLRSAPGHSPKTAGRDPYVQAELRRGGGGGGSGTETVLQTRRTSVRLASLEPHWDESLFFQLPQAMRGEDAAAVIGALWCVDASSLLHARGAQHCICTLCPLTAHPTRPPRYSYLNECHVLFAQR